MESPSTGDLIYTAFFFIDIVGLSNPVAPNNGFVIGGEYMKD